MEKNLVLGNEKYVKAVDSSKESMLVGEIQMIKAQAAQVLLFSSIEIGRRLTEAKALVNHGEWENWLKERVQFSQRTANNHMKIYREYGESGLAQNSQSIAGLNYTQAITLLSVPAEDRENFVEENNVKDMKISELKAQVEALNSEKNSLKKEIADNEKAYQKYLKAEEKSKKEIDSLKEHIESLKKQADEAEKNKQKDVQKQLQVAVKAEQKKLDKAEKDNQKLKDELLSLKEAQAETIEKARNAEKIKAEKEFAKKEKELQKTTATLQTQLKKATEEIEKITLSAEDEKKKNTELADITKCNTLIDDIISKYHIVIAIIADYSKVNPKNADEILNSLNKSLAITESKKNLKVVS